MIDSPPCCSKCLFPLQCDGPLPGVFIIREIGGGVILVGGNYEWLACYHMS